MIILGIDPGTAITGWGIIRNNVKSQMSNLKGQGRKAPVSVDDLDISLLSYGCVRTPSSLDMPGRLLILKNDLNKIILEHRPTVIAVERLFFNTNAKTAISVGQARGVVMLLAAEYKLNFFEYTALQVKKSLFGYGRASKKEMQKVTASILKVDDKIKSDDAADALAIAIFHSIRVSNFKF